RGYVHKRTRNQQDHVHDQQDHILVVRDTQQRRRYRLRDLQERHNPAEDVGHADQEYNHAAHLGAVHNDIPEGLEADVAVADAEDQRVNDRDGRALGRAEYARDDAADNNDDQGQGRDRLQGRLAEVRPAEL